MKSNLDLLPAIKPEKGDSQPERKEGSVAGYKNVSAALGSKLLAPIQSLENKDIVEAKGEENVAHAVDTPM